MMIMTADAIKKEISNWESFFVDHGIEENLTSDYISYISPLIANNVPVIFEIKHLSQLIGINAPELLKMIYSPSNFYREFEIAKRTGGKRKISTPYPSLKKCQSWIYENILKNRTISPYAHGYVQTRSIITNAKMHVGKNNLLKMDIKNFFPSISINWVIVFFKKLGYAHDISFYLASLCCLNNRLPQGAVTSPCLSNILTLSLDNRLGKLSEKYQVTYTRYADDLFFSGEKIPLSLIKAVTNIVTSYGLSVNTEKTHLIRASKRKIVTGVAVHNDVITLPRAYKKNIANTFYHIKKHGYLSHISKLKVKNPYYLESLIGKLNFWQQIEPDNEFVKNSISYLKKLKKQ
ncbi:retron St85 family RNA-directed DNA polymerase [Citrobacter portucalensis]|uniref:retron St85 family RNA-directed DNA polymerase n=1 Tax=Citrobacter portucalensis TaxID=1639133 RepID=UPI00254E1D37|nr:retron St85 family RNA-directed DNA polymerase [Citrobacter portucalensis]